MVEYKFVATLKDFNSDEDGEGKLILRVPYSEQNKTLGLNLQVKKILQVIIKTDS